jgi:hypothetical protein
VHRINLESFPEKVNLLLKIEKIENVLSAFTSGCLVDLEKIYNGKVVLEYSQDIEYPSYRGTSGSVVDIKYFDGTTIPHEKGVATVNLKSSEYWFFSSQRLDGFLFYASPFFAELAADHHNYLANMSWYECFKTITCKYTARFVKDSALYCGSLARNLSKFQLNLIPRCCEHKEYRYTLKSTRPLKLEIIAKKEKIIHIYTKNILAFELNLSKIRTEENIAYIPFSLFLNHVNYKNNIRCTVKVLEENTCVYEFDVQINNIPRFSFTLCKYFLVLQGYAEYYFTLEEYDLVLFSGHI